MITTVLGFVGVSVSGPSASSVTDRSSAVNQTQQLKNKTVNTTTKTTQKVTQ